LWPRHGGWRRLNAKLVSLAGALVATVGCPQMTPDGMDDTNGDSGAVEPVAGNGARGFAGDGGAALAAQLDGPVDVLVRPNGEVVIADAGNDRVRAVDTSGVIRTIAGGEGDELSMPTGVFYDADDGFYVASWGDHTVYRYAPDGGRERVAGAGAGACAANNPGARAIDATLNLPRSVGVWEGRLLIAEQGCHRVRQVTLADGMLSTFAGNGEAGYGGDDGPIEDARLQALNEEPPRPTFGFALSPEDPPDELYIADTANHVIREIRLFTGRIETFAGTGAAGYRDGPPSDAQFNRPAGVFTSGDHAVWVADTGNHVIRRVDPLGTAVTTVAGTGAAGFNGDRRPALETQLNNPTGVFVADGYVYIADTGNHCVRRFRYTGGD